MPEKKVKKIIFVVVGSGIRDGKKSVSGITSMIKSNITTPRPSPYLPLTDTHTEPDNDSLTP
jgi:hypothetical protein